MRRSRALKDQHRVDGVDLHDWLRFFLAQSPTLREIRGDRPFPELRVGRLEAPGRVCGRYYIEDDLIEVIHWPGRGPVGLALTVLHELVHACDVHHHRQGFRDLMILAGLEAFGLDVGDAVGQKGVPTWRATQDALQIGLYEMSVHPDGLWRCRRMALDGRWVPTQIMSRARSHEGTSSQS